MKRAVPAVADPAGKRVARPLRHTVLILHIVPTVFSERGDFSRRDAIFGLFFEVYGLSDFPTVYLIKWLSREFDLFTKFIK